MVTWIRCQEAMNSDKQYPMQCNAVCEKVVINTNTYSTYNLPDKPVDLPTNQTTIEDTTYIWTKKEDWTKINPNRDNIYNINQVSFTKSNQDFSFNITPIEIVATNDAFGDIRFHKVTEFTFSKFKDTEKG